MPGRSTVFARCAPCCIDKKFAAAVLSVYKRTDLVPADPAIDSAVLESVRIALCGVGLGRPVPPEHALGDSNSRSLDSVKGYSNAVVVERAAHVGCVLSTQPWKLIGCRGGGTAPFRLQNGD